MIGPHGGNTLLIGAHFKYSVGHLLFHGYVDASKRLTSGCILQGRASEGLDRQYSFQGVIYRGHMYNAGTVRLYFSCHSGLSISVSFGVHVRIGCGPGVAVIILCALVILASVCFADVQLKFRSV